MVGLQKAQRLLRAAASDGIERQAAVGEFVEAWASEIEDHFVQEEQLLLNLMSPAHVERFQEDHARLRVFASEAFERRNQEDPGADWSRALGQVLNDHIRWEERELFPAIENAASSATMQEIEKQTLLMESKRSRVASLRNDGSD
jgi:hemerythrin-like domain-containing protein